MKKTIDTYSFTNVSPDIPLKEFWKQNDHFADLFNTCMFNGKTVVDPRKLSDMNPDESVSILSAEFQATIKRARDVLKMSETGECYRILGIEDQQAIHYAMPLRCMVYDALTYLQQANMKLKQNRKEKKFATLDEFLSGFKKEDRLYPCYTIVVYWGEKAWDGPRSLEDMMEFGGDLGFQSQFCNYSMKLLCANETEELRPENDDVWKLFTAVRELYQNGGKNLSSILSDVSVEVAYIASLVTGTTAEYGKAIMEARRNRKERLDMCEAAKKAFMEVKAEGKAEGREEGRAEGIQALYKLIKKGGLSVADAADSMEMTEEEFCQVVQEIGLTL